MPAAGSAARWIRPAGPSRRGFAATTAARGASGTAAAGISGPARPAGNPAAAAWRAAIQAWLRCRGKAPCPFRDRASRAYHHNQRRPPGATVEPAMCYSAMVWESYYKYVSAFKADIDIKEFVRLFEIRGSGQRVLIPKGLELAFSSPQSEDEIHRLVGPQDSLGAGLASQSGHLDRRTELTV